jgi:hypothetical protein
MRSVAVGQYYLPRPSVGPAAWRCSRRCDGLRLWAASFHINLISDLSTFVLLFFFLSTFVLLFFFLSTFVLLFFFLAFLAAFFSNFFSNFSIIFRASFV